MSSTSRSPDDKPTSTEDNTEKKKSLAGARSPGRYSMADEDEVPPTRIDSTSMPAVHAELARPKAPVATPVTGAPRSERLPPRSADGGRKAPVGLPSRNGPISTRAVPQPAASTVRASAARGADGDASERNIQPATATTTPEAASSGPKVVDAGAATDDDGRLTEAKGSHDPPGEQERLKASEPAMQAVIPPSLTTRGPGPEGPVATEPRWGTPGARSSRPPKPASVVPPSAGAGRKGSSLRPPKASAPPPPPPPDASFLLDGFDEGSIAFAFDALVSEGPTGEPGTHEFDLAPVRELFSELAANHMRHVRDFMIDVKWGEVTRDWIHICVPPVRTLRRAAERLELPELTTALERLANELDAANAVGGQMLDTGEKERLLEAYGELVTLLPQAFALDRDKTQREGVIVQALLLQVPDVRKVTIDKLHAAGLTGLTVLFEANANDIAHVAGIPHALAVRIVERVQQYRAELSNSSPQDARAAEREKLAVLASELKAEHQAYDEAANGWGPEAKARKREHFRAREEKWLEISLLLARFGEVDRLQGIEKVPFAARIAQLADYLEEARDKYRAAEM